MFARIGMQVFICFVKCLQERREKDKPDNNIYDMTIKMLNDGIF